MLQKIKTRIRQLLCPHSFNCDKQIRVIICEKCGKKHWIKEFKNLF